MYIYIYIYICVFAVSFVCFTRRSPALRADRRPESHALCRSLVALVVDRCVTLSVSITSCIIIIITIISISIIIIISSSSICMYAICSSCPVAQEAIESC